MHLLLICQKLPFWKIARMQLNKCCNKSVSIFCWQPSWSVYFGLRPRPGHKDCAWRNPIEWNSLLNLLVPNRNLLRPERLQLSSLWLLQHVRLLLRLPWWLRLPHLVTWCSNGGGFGTIGGAGGWLLASSYAIWAQGLFALFACEAKILRSLFPLKYFPRIEYFCCILELGMGFCEI